MEDFEKQIQESLRRKDPSPWLESRILAAAAERPRARFWQSRFRWAIALGAVVVVVSGAAWQRERVIEERDRAAGMAAKERLQLALKITSVKLQQIQREVVAQND
jgi:hypothetical protein